MATAYPGSLDTNSSQLRTDIASSDDMNASGKEHHLMHVNVHGAAIALETKLGTGSSTASTGAVLMGTGSGASAWDTSPTILGALTVGADGSGHDVTFYSGTAGDSFVWDSSEEKLTITGTNGQVALAVADGNVSITDDLDVDGTLEADAITVDGTALSEYIADTVGAMVGSNTETNITVTYEDSDNTLDFVIGTLNQDTTGTAATVTTNAQPAITSVGTLTGLNLSGDIDTAQDFVLGNGEGEQILIQGSTNQLFFQTSGTYRAWLNADGDFLPYATNAYDLGSSSKRWGSLYAGATDITSLTIANGSAGTPSIRFSGDTNTGIYMYDISGTNEGIGFATNGTVRGTWQDAGLTLSTCSEGTGDNIEINGYGVLVKDSSSASVKNITDVNVSDHLNASMVDDLQLKMWSYKNDTSNHPQISLIAEEANAVSPFLNTNKFDEDGNVVPSGLSNKGLISLLIIALKDARTRITALEG